MQLSKNVFMLFPFFCVFPLFGQIMIDSTHEFTDSKFPIVIIDTQGNEIKDTPRVEAHMGIIFHENGARNSIQDDYDHYDGKIGIEYRGSSSASYPKKQYRLETIHDDGSNNNVSLLGMPKENDWILYGPYNDQSLIRNVLMYELSNQIGRYAVRTAYCELILNGDYKGLYIFMEKIKRDKNRLDIAKLDADDVAGDSLTGGYILKIDKYKGENNAWFVSAKYQYYQYHYPKPDEIQPEQAQYIQNFINHFESVLLQPGNNAVQGFPEVIDVPSFVDHFILNEFSTNVDAYRISAYMFKNRDDKDGKLNAGPIWDMNLSLGKAFFYQDLYITDRWSVDYNQYRPGDGGVPRWWVTLRNDPYFMHQVYERWQELRATFLDLDTFFGTIDSHVDNIEEARIRNTLRWPEMEQSHDYATEINMLKDWIEAHVIWMDDNLYDYGNNVVEKNDIAKPNTPEMVVNYPNPFNPETTIQYRLAQPSDVQLKIFSLEGQEVQTIFTGLQSQGLHQLQWNGINQNGIPVASGVYMYQIQTHNQILRGRMNLVK